MQNLKGGLCTGLAKTYIAIKSIYILIRHEFCVGRNGAGEDQGKTIPDLAAEPCSEQAARKEGWEAYLIPNGGVPDRILSCQRDAAEQDEKEDQVGENIIINDAMAVDPKSATTTTKREKGERPLYLAKSSGRK